MAYILGFPMLAIFLFVVVPLINAVFSRSLFTDFYDGGVLHALEYLIGTDSYNILFTIIILFIFALVVRWVFRFFKDF